MELEEALLSLDPLDDDQWTQEKAPKLDVLKELVGEAVTRQQVIDVAPQFTRENMVVGTPKEDNDAEEEGLREGRQEEVMPSIDDYLDREDVLEPHEVSPFLEKMDDKELPLMMQALDEQMDEATKNIEAAKELYRKLKYAKAITGVTMKARVPNTTNTEAIREYINRQTSARANRYERAAKIKQEFGLDLSKMDPRSMIDRAMSRKRQRGTERPKRGQMQ